MAMPAPRTIRTSRTALPAIRSDAWPAWSRTIIAVARTAEAFADDCVRAKLVIARRDPPTDCAATVIDRSLLRASGALALRRIGESWDIAPTRPPGYDRPWAKAASEHAAVARDAGATATSPRDATPASEDLDPGD